MSRKTIVAVLGVLTVIFTSLKVQFDLGMDVIAVLGGLSAVILYVLFEAKLDLRKFGAQAGKWKDPKFWLALVAIILAALNKELGLHLPGDAIVAVLTVIMTILFKVKFTNGTI